MGAAEEAPSRPAMELRRGRGGGGGAQGLCNGGSEAAGLWRETQTDTKRAGGGDYPRTSMYSTYKHA